MFLSLSLSLATSMLLRASSLNCRLRGASGKGTGIASLIGLGHKNSSSDMDCNVAQHRNNLISDQWLVVEGHQHTRLAQLQGIVNNSRPILKAGAETWVTHLTRKEVPTYDTLLVPAEKRKHIRAEHSIFK